MKSVFSEIVDLVVVAVLVGDLDISIIIIIIS